ncbi:integrase [Burkholderia ubonensis]|nr:integrase [Burkholderia ubonensis]KWE77809.1 integrase [Burkholderia ubonensis]
MATLERITYTPHVVSASDGTIRYEPSSRKVIENLPQIFWSDSLPWREANLWAVERASSRDTSLRTVNSNLSNLLNYANFLETHDLLWFVFPVRKADRCLVRYRGWLIDERNAGRLSPSTASEFMRNVVLFYRWLVSRGLLVTHAPLWRDQVAYLRFFDSVGFERTVVRVSTDLAIPNRKSPGERLEDGLLPVSANDRDVLLSFAKANTTPELYRMLAVGFFTGMRIGSISDLKIRTLQNAVRDPSASGLYRISIGPGASPPVHTKFGVTGQVWIPEALLEDLLDYATSVRRSKRQAAARREDKDLLFLTRQGNPYCRRDSEQSTAINTEMASLRQAGAAAGVNVLTAFHFHQARCTFATEIATIALRSGDPLNAIALVKNALLHRDEATSFRYIKFVSTTPAKQAASNEFMRVFSGLSHEHR